MSGIIRRACDRQFRPWKNGGGETAEILCHPENAGFDAFQWRISTARVASSGPFSVFPGVDRVLTVLEGGAMTLHLPDGQAVLQPGSDPFAFSGDVPCHADLHDTALLDLNVMVRRPLAARVTPAASYQDPAPACLMRCVFALEPVAGLARHDLRELPDAPFVPQPGTLIIEIFSP